MKWKPVIKSVFGVFLFCLMLHTTVPAAQITETDTVPLGVGKDARVRIGEEYMSGAVWYEAKITFLEVARGEKAWSMIKDANAANKPPDAGTEYLVAKARFEFGEKDAKGSETYALREEQFAPASSEGKYYDRPALVPPQPAFSGRLYLGESLEGWIVFAVATEDKKPLVAFGHENYGRVWFRLY